MAIYAEYYARFQGGGIGGGGVGAIFIGAMNVNFDTDADNDDAYVLTTTQMDQYENGQEFIFVAERDSDSDVTVEVNDFGAVDVYQSGSRLGSGDVTDGDVLRIIYDGTDFQALSGATQTAAEVPTSITNFGSLLISDPVNVQEALDALDDVVASNIPVDASGFDGNMDSSVNTVQKLAQFVDDDTADLGIASRDTDSLEVTSSKGTNAEIPSATTSLAGLQSSADKTKLDGAVDTVLDLTDTPNAYGTAGQVMAINTATDAFEFGDIEIALVITQDENGLSITATASVE